MINRFLPYALIIDGREYAARTDFGVAIDALIALADEDLSYDEKAISVLQIIYPGYREIENITEAIVQAYWFLDGGDFIKSAHRSKVRLMDWAQDFKIISSAVNRVLGYDCRSISYDHKSNTRGLHWWTFLSAYFEIGECTFSSVVSIRDKNSRSKKLESWEKEYYDSNRELIDLQTKYSSEEESFFAELGL